MPPWNSALFLTALLTGCTADKEDSTEDGSENQDTSEDTDSPDPQYNIWSGPTLTFTKESSADITDPANQDAITDLVVLTRGSRGSLFNVVIEEAAEASSPLGTEWAVGDSDSIADLEFQPLKAAVNDNMAGLPGKSLVLHLIDEDIYIDVTFISWATGGGGGGFSYERSTQ